MIKNNLKLDRDTSYIYGNIDGLSLQNLFYAKNGYFPSCFMFSVTPEKRQNVINVKNLMSYLNDKYKDTSEMSYVEYVCQNVVSDKVKYGYCIFFEKKNLYARIESDITEAYILYDNNNFENVMELAEDIKKFWEGPEEEENNIFTLAYDNYFHLNKSKVKEIPNFDISKLYNDNFVSENEIIEDFIGDKGKSGLVILHGEKGTGKTSYIKHLINKHSDVRFITVPANVVTLLAEPSFSSFLPQLQNHVIILEDCENIIMDRKITGSSGAVSLLLNLSDGLLSDDLGLKFICTFNEDIKTIDKALLRKGRLISKYEFKELEANKANNLLKELYPDVEIDNVKPMTLADIFHYTDKSYEITKKSLI